jgi:hypothetical protein
MKAKVILKQVTSEVRKREIEKIQKVKFPPELQKWVKEYEKVGDRNEFIWKWTYRSIQIVTLPNILLKYRKSLMKVKFLMVMFITLLDDIADKTKNINLLNELLKVPFESERIESKHLNKNEKEYLNFTQMVWYDIRKIIITLPYYQNVKMAFEFDLKILLMNAICYGYLVNKNHYLINKVEYQEHFAYNIQGFINLDLDLMCCYNKFNKEDEGSLREIAWRSQKLAQMINWISTWEREILEDDFTSGVFAFAVDRKILAVSQLKKKYSQKNIEKIRKSNLENEILAECNEEYRNIRLIGNGLKNKSIEKFILNFKEFIIIQLCSKGYY